MARLAAVGLITQGGDRARGNGPRCRHDADRIPRSIEPAVVTVVGRQEYAWWRARTTDQRRYCYSHKRRLESHTREKRNDLS